MKSSEVRRVFLDFFERKGHQIVPSAPIVVKNDPTLMFTNAGMNQFKDLFLGNETPAFRRVADTQKCLRVSGKHNDLEEVGVDTYHHTMFEMLGNWSFGDYFKKEAIEWAWELLTQVYKLSPDRLYVTVFEGDSKENLAFDEEARSEWLKWIPEDRILKGNKKDNFWEMGDTGPCGPCSEIHVDLRPEQERAAVDARTLVNNDHPQVIEIWNLVFMEYERRWSSEELMVYFRDNQFAWSMEQRAQELVRCTSLAPLKDKHVDTGMGFERLCRAIEGKASNYDTDVFMPLIRFVEHACKKEYGKEEKTDIAMRVLADHIRAISFAILDGQLPSNTGAGYVIRRILRRAVRYYYSFLDRQEPLLYRMVPVMAEGFSGIFPELNDKKTFVEQVIREEELSFLRTLDRGISRLESLLIPGGTIQGNSAFELYDQFGFPIDLTLLIARENNVTVDKAGFDLLLEEQKNRSRKATAMATGDWQIISKDETVEFVGYEELECDIRITRMRAVTVKNKQVYQLVFDRTPFYAESGGQVGDTGVIESANEIIRILDTQKENNLIIHLAERFPENPEVVFHARVDEGKRKSTEANHTATHLLHAALRTVLGTHVEQKGSLVHPDYLRFDFSHFKAMSREELLQVERLVNEKIRSNIALEEQRNIPLAEAKRQGAMALFGEKYGDSVRMITFDPAFSRELCGGTHVRSTGQIGVCKITAETAVAAGIRRIEAVTATRAVEWMEEAEQQLAEIRELLKTKEPAKGLLRLLEEKAQLEEQLSKMEGEQTQVLKKELMSALRAENGIHTLIARINIPNAEELKNLSFQLRNETERLFCVLGTVLNDKPMLSVIISEELVREKQWHAGHLVKELAREIKGGGGGQAFYATAGGSELSGLDAALDKAKKIVNDTV